MDFPWEMNWGAEEPASPPKAEGKKPWLLDWAEKTFSKSPQKPQEAPVAASKPLGDGLTLDTVFEGLKQAESRGLHINAKTGGLTTSPAGAEGITQLMPKTAAKPGYGIAPVKDKSEKEYLRVGREYLAAMHKKYGDWEMALAAYNAGVGNVDKAKGKAERFGGNWKDYLPKKEETLPYIDRVLGRGKKTSALTTPKDKFYEGTSGEQMVKNVKGTAYDIASMTPGVGDAMSLVEAVKSFKNKEYAEAGLNALGVLPFVPSAAGIIRSKPYFHGTRKEFEKHDNGLIFLTEQPDTAASYASGAGGQRGGAKTAFYKDSETNAIYEQRGEELVQVTGKGKGKKLPADVDELQDMGIYPTEDGMAFRKSYNEGNKTSTSFYRGDNSDVNAANLKLAQQGALGKGFYVTGDKEAAKGYGSKLSSYDVEWKKPLVVQGDVEAVKLIAQDENFWKTNFNTRGSARKWAEDQIENHGGIGDPEFLDMLKAAGYDGVVYKNSKGTIVEATAINRGQIKDKK